LRLWLRVEAKRPKALINTSSGVQMLDCVLRLLLALPLIFFGLHHRQLFLFDPLSLDLTFLCGLLAEIFLQVDSLVLVVFLKSQGFWLNFLGLLCDDLFVRDIFFAFLDVLVLVQVILDISNVSLASSSFPGFITTSMKKYTLPVPDLLSWKWPSPNCLVWGVGGCLGFLMALAFYLIFSGRGSEVTPDDELIFCLTSCCCLNTLFSACVLLGLLSEATF